MHRFVGWIKILFLYILYAQNNGEYTIPSSSEPLPADTASASWCYREGFNLRNQDPEAAEILARKGYELAKRCGSEYWMGKNIMLQGLALYKKGYWKKSIPYYIYAYTMQVKIPDSLGMLYTLINLGNALEEGNFFTQADSVWHCALLLSEKLRQGAEYLKILSNMGTMHVRLKNFSQAHAFFFTAYRQALQMKNYEMLGILCNNIGAIHLMQNHWKEALPYMEDALKYYSVTENDFGRKDALVNLLQIYVREGRLEESQTICRELEQSHHWMQIPENKKEFFKWRAIWFAAKGDSGRAYRDILQHLWLSDSLASLSTTPNVASLKISFMFKQKNFSKNIMLFLLVVCGSMIVWHIWHNRKRFS